MTATRTKTKRCKVCRNPFEPRSAMHTVCGYACAVALTDAKRQKEYRQQAKEARKALRERRVLARPRSYYVKAAQQAANAYVRARDAGKPCISCGALPGQKYGGAMDCGHYRSTGSAPHLRFDADRNMAAQCVKCNRYLGGNAVQFRAGLVARIGLEAVEALEADQEPRKWSIDQLKAIRAEFVAKRKALEADK